jgi:uncharacterized protein
MLLKFRCKNFRSIREEQELSLVAAKTRSDEKDESLIITPLDNLCLLRSAVIYGPNASGKSNVLDAFAAFRRIVSDSWRSWKPNGPIPEFDPFLLDETSKEGETEFQLTFSITDRIYRYSFSFDQRVFREESLIDTTGNNKILFHRSSELPGMKFPSRNLGKSSAAKRHLESIEHDVRPNSLFLSAAAQKAHPILSPIYASLSESFRALHWKNLKGRETYTREKCTDANYKAKILALIRFADGGINDILISRRDMPEDQRKMISAVMTALRETDPEAHTKAPPEIGEFPSISEIEMVHAGASGRSYALEESKESDGTRAYFSAIGPILDALEEGSVLLIDEIETSLHPKLTRELVRIFNSAEFNKKGAQFIFTTHDTNLLDLDLMRRDQIWFTQKDREGATELYPLSSFQPRTSQNIEAGYLGGRFGALPFLDETVLREFLTQKSSSQSSLSFSDGE